MAVSSRSQDCFIKVLSHSLKVAADDIISTALLNEAAVNDDDIKAGSMSRIMLTIAGIDFRVSFLLHYRDGDQLRQFIKNTSSEEGSSSPITDKETLDAYFLEMGNRFCGEAKRLCYESFDHLGMSTPCVLSATTTIEDMHNEDLQCQGHVRFESAGTAILAGSVFVYGKGNIELNLDESHFVEQEGTGELEFF